MELFRPSIQTALTAIALSLSTNADRETDRLGEVVFLVEPDNPKPIYTFTFNISAARLSLASPVTDSILSDAGRIPKLVADKALARPISLLSTSLSRETDSLQRFMAAWSALEIFVNSTFKTTYESRWFEIMENGAPTSAKPVFLRFRDVMSDKYRLADKFLIITSVLDSDSATNDIENFKTLKSVRDNLLHGLAIPPYLPTENVQNLLFKYLSLHLV